MRVARASGAGILAVAAGFLAVGLMIFGKARAGQIFSNDAEVFAHINALVMFENGCVKTAPEFGTAFASFLAGGLGRTEGGLWTNDSGELRAAVIQSTNARTCTVGLANGLFDSFVEQIRVSLATQWSDLTYSDSYDEKNKVHHFTRITDTLATDYEVIVRRIEGAGMTVMIYRVPNSVLSQ